ncbi:MAG TPA: helix-turn-helix transcriptional regulator [Armatimonadota bacterium]|jgi:transcriptional regulator with XRE-family HTH domain
MHQGRKSKELRDERGWTQEQLRDHLERIGRRMTRSNISLMESREWLEGELISDLTKVYRVSPSTFFEGPVPDGETREEQIDRAFEFIRRDRTVNFGSSLMAKLPSEAKLAIIRMYEDLKHVKLLPDEVV